MDLLSRREYSRRELYRKLAPHAESPDELEALLDELGQRGWQSDNRFAEQFAEIKGRKYGSRRLAAEMREKGIEGEAISAALAEHDDTELARQLWQKKFGQPPQSAEERVKQIRFLANRGIAMDAIRKVLSWANSDEFGHDE